MLNNTACTSRIVVLTPRNDSSVTPLNLTKHFTENQYSSHESVDRVKGRGEQSQPSAVFGQFNNTLENHFQFLKTSSEFQFQLNKLPVMAFCHIFSHETVKLTNASVKRGEPL